VEAFLPFAHRHGSSCLSSPIIVTAMVYCRSSGSAMAEKHIHSPQYRDATLFLTIGGFSGKQIAMAYGCLWPIPLIGSSLSYSTEGDFHLRPGLMAFCVPMTVAN
jgi:hypothetical protein